MEYVYATLTLEETDSEINETNLTAVLEAAGADVTESRVKAFVAALEGVDIGTLRADAGLPVDAQAPADTDADAPADAEDDAEDDSIVDGDARTLDDGDGDGARNGTGEETESSSGTDGV